MVLDRSRTNQNALFSTFTNQKHKPVHNKTIYFCMVFACLDNMEWILARFNVNCRSLFHLLQWANEAKLHVFATKHKSNTNYEHLISWWLRLDFELIDPLKTTSYESQEQFIWVYPSSFILPRTYQEQNISLCVKLWMYNLFTPLFRYF